MTKIFKAYTLTFIMLITSFKALQSDIPNPSPSPSYWQVIIGFFSGNPQPQENPNQAPAGITEDDYIIQLRYDLNGPANQSKIPVIPWNEVYEMEAALRIELRNINLRDKDKVNQIIRSVMCNQVRIGAIRDLDESKQNFYVTSNDYETIPNAYEGNIRARLHRMPHLNGEAIAQYFGEPRKHAIQNSLPKRNPNSTHYY